MSERLSGKGPVRVKRNGAAVASAVPYSLHVTAPATGRLGHIDASVGLDFATALPPFQNNEALTLTLEDGREFDFLVKSVAMLPERVSVIAQRGALRSPGETSE